MPGEAVVEQRPGEQVQDLSSPAECGCPVGDEGALVVGVDGFAVVAEPVEGLEVRVGLGEEAELVGSAMPGVSGGRS